MLKLGLKAFTTSFGIFNPFELNFAITYKCNSRCRTCGIWKKKTSNELTIREIELIAKKLGFIKWIRLTGGEPFLRRDYVRIVRLLDKHIPGLYMLTTPTNGFMTGLIVKDVRAVLSFFKKRYVVTVSLDGPETIHNRIKGINSWQRAVNTYKALKPLEKKHKNFRVFFGYTISPFNLGRFGNTIESVKEHVPDIGVNDFHVNLAQKSDIFYTNKRFQVTGNYWKEAKKEVINILKLRGLSANPIHLIQNRYLKLGIKYLETRKTPIECNIFNLSCFIDPNANVYPCTIFNRRLGNLRENSYDLMQILKSAESKIVKKEIIGKKCPGCWTPCEAHQMIISRLGKS